MPCHLQSIAKALGRASDSELGHMVYRMLVGNVMLEFHFTHFCRVPWNLFLLYKEDRIKAETGEAQNGSGWDCGSAVPEAN